MSNFPDQIRIFTLSEFRFDFTLNLNNEEYNNWNFITEITKVNQIESIFKIEELKRKALFSSKNFLLNLLFFINKVSKDKFYIEYFVLNDLIYNHLLSGLKQEIIKEYEENNIQITPTNFYKSNHFSIKFIYNEKLLNQANDKSKSSNNFPYLSNINGENNLDFRLIKCDPLNFNYFILDLDDFVLKGLKYVDALNNYISHVKTLNPELVIITKFPFLEKELDFNLKESIIESLSLSNLILLEKNSIKKFVKNYYSKDKFECEKVFIEEVGYEVTSTKTIIIWEYFSHLTVFLQEKKGEIAKKHRFFFGKFNLPARHNDFLISSFLGAFISCEIKKMKFELSFNYSEIVLMKLIDILVENNCLPKDQKFFLLPRVKNPDQLKSFDINEKSMFSSISIQKSKIDKKDINELPLLLSNNDKSLLKVNDKKEFNEEIKENTEESNFVCSRDFLREKNKDEIQKRIQDFQRKCLFPQYGLVKNTEEIDGLKKMSLYEKFNLIPKNEKKTNLVKKTQPELKETNQNYTKFLQKIKKL